MSSTELLRCERNDCHPCNIEKNGCGCGGCFHCVPGQYQRPACLKKRRRLIIVDIESDGIPYTGPVVVAQPPTPYVPPSPGSIHSATQKEVLELCRKARCDEMNVDPHIWKKVDLILAAPSVEEAHAAAKRALDSASIYFIMNTKHPEKQAKAAERIAKMWRTKGEDEKADAQLAKAKKIRADMAKEGQR